MGQPCNVATCTAQLMPALRSFLHRCLSCLSCLPAGQTSLAYVTAATHGLEEEAERLGEQLGELRPQIDTAQGEHAGPAGGRAAAVAGRGRPVLCIGGWKG